VRAPSWKLRVRCLCNIVRVCDDRVDSGARSRYIDVVRDGAAFASHGALAYVRKSGPSWQGSFAVFGSA
jgi:hypothetical protein